MKEVEFSYVLKGGEEEILTHLSPIQIAEYMGYTARGSKENESAKHLRVRKYNTEFTLDIREKGNGYEFSQYGSEGPFRVLDGNIQIESEGNVEDREASRVTVNITYTIGSLFSFVLDWLARRLVKQDAKSLLNNLAKGLAEERADTAGDVEDGEGGKGQDGRETDEGPNYRDQEDGRTNGGDASDRSKPAVERDRTE